MTKARDIASATTPNANAALLATFPHRNLIINGAMQVAQRATSVASVSSSGVYRTVDRFFNDLGSSGTFTVSQASDGPTGFANSFKLDCTTADASPNYHLFLQKIEGQNLQQIAKGTSSAQPITLSFYVKSNKAGTYSVNARDRDNDRFCYKSYTIDSANTWERKSVTFPADTTGVLDDDNANSMDIEWWVAAGSTYNSGTTTGVWGSNVSANRAAANTVNIGTSTDDEWLITGIQLEVGDTATPFEHRSFGDELARCQRYYYQTQTNEHSVHTNRSYNNGNTYYGTVTFPSTMRATPTFSAQNNQINLPAISNTTGTFGTYNLTRHRGIISITPASDFGAYTYTVVAINNAMKFDAEL
jgi:hypothetical protein